MECAPSPAAIQHAIARAVAHRRDLAQRDAGDRQPSDALLCESIIGVPTHPCRVQDGWWLVGHVLDSCAAETDEFAVWLLPGQRRLQLAARQYDVAAPPQGDCAERWWGDLADAAQRSTARSG